MIYFVIYLVIASVLIGLIILQAYNIKTLSDSLESYAYTCNRLAHENAELRKLVRTDK